MSSGPQARWGRLTWPPCPGAAQLRSCGCRRWALQPGGCRAARGNSQFSPKSTQSLVRLSQSRDALLLGPLSSVTAVREAAALWRELDCLRLALVLKRRLTANVSTKGSKKTACAKPTRDIPPADHHQREKRIKHSKPQHAFPFLAALRRSH